MFLKYNWQAMLWALIILVLCGIPGKDIPHISFLELLSFDKFVHAGVFFVLMILSLRGFLVQTRFVKLQQSAKPIALIICITYGALMELMQGTLFEGRSASVLDIVANSFGCVVGLLLYKKIEQRFLIYIIR
jgi:hypothetical protein